MKSNSQIRIGLLPVVGENSNNNNGLGIRIDDGKFQMTPSSPFNSDCFSLYKDSRTKYFRVFL